MSPVEPENEIKPPSKPTDFGLDDRKESVKTYIEQTKLLVTLASAFVVAPVVLTSAIKGELTSTLSHNQLSTFVAAEIMFILSILLGYVVLATISGSQVLGEHWIYRPATTVSSLLQITTYVLGLALLILFAYFLMASPTATSPVKLPLIPIDSKSPQSAPQTTR
ncbi:hypothetical protein GOD82_28615 [Sinorhizobium medicae]|nr:hypothetical protein [Sinorhizobium medicae]